MMPVRGEVLSMLRIPPKTVSEPKPDKLMDDTGGTSAGAGSAKLTVPSSFIVVGSVAKSIMSDGPFSCLSWE